uniref:Flagellar assembly protein FliH n=1 Tax=Magnetococcus massalia (strain MO-1) TaxID=451514 RepID=A0A1S7LNZ0_MAGMO|nr:putative flagellar export apparatus component FliH [Candidatus Magnetococcus massalia]
MDEDTPMNAKRLYTDRHDEPPAGGFQSFVDMEAPPLKDEFIGYMPNGHLPSLEVEEPPAIIEEEEVEQRRQEQLERELYQKVFAAAEQAGMEAGLRKMEEEISSRLPRLEGIMRDLDGLPQRVFAASEQYMVETCITLLEELLAHELTVNKESLKARVHRLLKEVSTRDRSAVHVSPHDAELLQSLPEFNGLEIIGDPMVPEGTARLESTFGGIEDDISDRMTHIQEGIRSFLHERQEEPEIYDAAVGAGEIPVPGMEQDDAEQELDGLSDSEEIVAPEDAEMTSARLAALEAQTDKAAAAETSEMTQMGREDLDGLRELLAQEELQNTQRGDEGSDTQATLEGDDAADDDECIIGPGHLPGIGDDIAPSVAYGESLDETTLHDSAADQTAKLAVLEAGGSGDAAPTEVDEMTSLDAGTMDDLDDIFAAEVEDQGEGGNDELAGLTDFTEVEEDDEEGGPER